MTKQTQTKDVERKGKSRLAKEVGKTLGGIALGWILVGQPIYSGVKGFAPFFNPSITLNSEEIEYMHNLNELHRYREIKVRNNEGEFVERYSIFAPPEPQYRSPEAKAKKREEIQKRIDITPEEVSDSYFEKRSNIIFHQDVCLVLAGISSGLAFAYFGAKG